MKVKHISLLSILLSLVAALGCNDDSPKEATLDDLSPYVQQFLAMRNGSRAYLADNVNAMNSSYQGLLSNLAANGRVKDDSVKNDSTLFPDPWTWQTCATVTEIQNEDGSLTTIHDYGDGCSEGFPGYYYWVFGKITETWKGLYEEDDEIAHYDYNSATTYENYGAQYIVADGDTTDWITDGHFDSDGVAFYNKTTGVFTGEFSYDGESVSTTDGVSSAYKSKSHCTYDVNGSVTDVNEYEYAYDGNYYSSKVTSPLVSDYSCNNVDNWETWVSVAVSGVEVIHFKQNGQEGTFTIDYGNGECDNIVWVTENGVTVKVDLGIRFWMHTIDVGVGG